jgi:hypothetical protein
MQNILISKANHVFQKSDTTELPEQPTNHAEELVSRVTHILPNYHRNSAKTIQNSHLSRRAYHLLLLLQ